MDDLVTFADRSDMPALLQAAIAHAQFESIHPFTDGNGRIGRALINAILRRQGATTRVVVPLASALVARRENYFDVLGSYRSGDLAPLVGTFVRSTGCPWPNRASPRNAFTKSPASGGNSPDRYDAAALPPRSWRCCLAHPLCLLTMPSR